ncbi:thiamine pyrophosphate-binding protein [Clostridium cellulovorans]|uniref:Thiamine pyrophosphate TPP-binding domain-containing protein n=1 Tax=Clostridium cellulovorans (strain ATCC 35296 / DSM 3052 / OCM 3 / 743B) TaxID=573061 RepID=D9SQE9_CLOC7|nr:thiamine pyrophosphate-binding protein [Clostridium cellulovorans]ADL50216.1 thiamine pyrophosphate TPP-binding domain-containing protein [Clostridium cellulovorans 743B]
MNVKTGKEAIIEQFLADGITHMFGNPGTVEQGFLDALEKYPDFHYILTLQESIAVAMADGYARKTKKPTVVQLHSGVGLGNGIGMIYQAKRGHAPLVVINGESGIKYEAMDAQMAADVVAMAEPVTKWSTKVVDPESLLRVLRRAIKIATTPPMGPVFVCLPMDILDAPIQDEIVPTSILNTRSYPEEKTLESAAEILASAKYPMIIMGDGITFSGAQEELVKVAELIGAEVWGADSSEVNISASHPQFRGLLGHMFGEQSKKDVEEADAVLIVGTYIFPEVFPLLKGIFANGAKLIHVDLDSYEIAKNFPVDIGIVSDPKSTLSKLAEVLDKTMAPDQRLIAALNISRMVKEKAKTIEEMNSKDEKLMNSFPIYPPKFMQELARQLPKDAIIFDEALTSSPDLNRYIPATVPGQFFQTRGGSLGVGIPGAMGIKLAAKDKTVIAFTGDGGSMYTIQALWTAVHHNIDAKFIICNNKSYRLLMQNIDQYWKERDIPKHEYPKSFILDNPDIRFDQLSESMGVSALRIEKPEEIADAVQRMLSTKGPFLIDLVIENNQYTSESVCKCGQ